MGFFGGLDADKFDRQYSDSYLFKRLIDYLRPYSKRLGLASLMGILTALALASWPILIAAGVGALEEEAPVWIVSAMVGGMLITGAGRYFANWVFRRQMSQIVGHVTAQMRKDAFEATVKRDMAFFDENKSGKILSRITTDTQEFAQVFTFSFELVIMLTQALVLVIVLFQRNVQLTLVLLAFAPVILLFAWFFRWLARNVTRQGTRAMAAVNDNIQESVSGISVAKNFRREAMMYGEFDEINRQSYGINMKRGFVLSLVFPVLNVVAGFGVAGMMYVGAVAVVNQVIAVGTWYLYIQSVDRFWFPFINMASFWSQFQQAMSDLERIFSLIDAENTVQQIDNQPVAALTGNIVFDDVTFGYVPEQAVLKRFTLDIQPGESVALVGHTGAGKSTIVKLITRFYEFQAGEICIDGQDIRSFDLQQYRSRLGLVPQSPFLFSGTIMDNVRYGRPAASDAEIEEVAYSIGKGEWLETIPEGLQTDVGERGAKLSMGQRQLVSLLRVLVQKPVVFILDEATASIDPFTEMQIQEALDMILAQSTSIMIAHRLSTVRSADRIIVLRDGEIIEEGDHETLMGAQGHYAELYNTYFRHQSLSYIESARDVLLQDAK